MGSLSFRLSRPNTHLSVWWAQMDLPYSNYRDFILRINAFCCMCQRSHTAFAVLVGSNGLEPSTSRLSGARSNRLSYEPIFGCGSVSSALPFDLSVGGGDEGIRTLDPLRARQVLSQLSYTPVFLRALRAFLFSASESTFAPSKLNNVTRFPPLTLGLYISFFQLMRSP